MTDYKLTADVLRNISYAMHSAEESDLKLNWYPIIQRLGKVMNAYPNVNWLDVLSRGQLDSKIWLISKLEQLDIELRTVFICGGWYASLALMMFNSKLNIGKIRSFDIDPSCVNIADTSNRDHVLDEWKFKAVTQDIHNINYTGHTYTTHRADGQARELYDEPDTFINTSCEHIENFAGWYSKLPKGKLVCVQSNDYFSLPEHVNCSKNLLEFAEQTPMSECLYEGVLDLIQYNRFMRIGIR